MTTPEIFGWATWAVLAFFTVAWTIACYVYFRRAAGPTYSTLNITIVWWFLLGWTFYYSAINKLHLLWIAPSVLLLSLLVTTSRAIATMDQRRMMPPGLLILLCAYGLVLWWLTD
jgi:hypothetical protein